MPEFIPRPQLPTGLASQVLELIKQQQSANPLLGLISAGKDIGLGAIEGMAERKKMEMANQAERKKMEMANQAEIRKYVMSLAERGALGNAPVGQALAPGETRLSELLGGLPGVPAKATVRQKQEVKMVPFDKGLQGAAKKLGIPYEDEKELPEDVAKVLIQKVADLEINKGKAEAWKARITAASGNKEMLLEMQKALNNDLSLGEGEKTKLIREITEALKTKYLPPKQGGKTTQQGMLPGLQIR